jgi:hypothetical protein
VAGIESVRRALCDWLDWMGLIDAGPQSRLDRYIGYYEPYATSHDALDEDRAVQQEVRNAASALTAAIGDLRRGALSQPDRACPRRGRNEPGGSVGRVSGLRVQRAVHPIGPRE